MRVLRTLHSFAIATIGLAAALAATLAMLSDGAQPAVAAAAPCFAQLPGRGGIPPWGFHTGDPLTGTTGWYSRAYGNIDLNANTISGEVCQAHYAKHKEGLVVMRTESPLISHTHYSHKWGYPGNEIKVHVKVISSTDLSCAVGTVGVMDMYASYNGVRSDSVTYTFPKACGHEDHTYHGAQVNAQVPPL